MPIISNLIGRRFGKLVAVRPTDERKNRSVVWECKCDCGNTSFAAANQLQAGHVKSCGCAGGVDLTGQRFGKLIAVRPTSERWKERVVWECKCDCGNTAFVAMQYLQRGSTRSCGCAKRGNKGVDIAGQRFGKLIAVRPTSERQNRNVVWECKCDCGNTKFAPANQLRAGIVKSCGCLSSAKTQGAGEADI